MGQQDGHPRLRSAVRTPSGPASQFPPSSGHPPLAGSRVAAAGVPIRPEENFATDSSSPNKMSVNSPRMDGLAADAPPASPWRGKPPRSWRRDPRRGPRKGRCGPEGFRALTERLGAKGRGAGSCNPLVMGALEQPDPATVPLLEAAVVLVPPWHIGTQIDRRGQSFGQVPLHHLAGEEVEQEDPGDH